MRTRLHVSAYVSFTDREREIINTALRNESVQDELYFGEYPRDIGGRVNTSGDGALMKPTQLDRLSQAVELAMAWGDNSEAEIEEWSLVSSALEKAADKIRQA